MKMETSIRVATLYTRQAMPRRLSIADNGESTAAANAINRRHNIDENKVALLRACIKNPTFAESTFHRSVPSVHAWRRNNAAWIGKKLPKCSEKHRMAWQIPVTDAHWDPTRTRMAGMHPVSA
jgi:hypothetical protein